MAILPWGHWSVSSHATKPVCCSKLFFATFQDARETYSADVRQEKYFPFCKCRSEGAVLQEGKDYWKNPPYTSKYCSGISLVSECILKDFFLNKNTFALQNALLLHVQRAAYQAGIWATCAETQPNIPSPAAWGWKWNEESWEPVWATVPEAPKACKQLIKCACQLKCSSRCSCHRASLTCTELCSCKCTEWKAISINYHKGYQPETNINYWSLIQVHLVIEILKSRNSSLIVIFLM